MATTAYCPKCREDVEVPWPPPPYSVKHIDGVDGEAPFHAHPEAQALPTRTEVSAETFDRLLAELDEAPRVIPELAEAIRKRGEVIRLRWFPCPKCGDQAERYAREIQPDYGAAAECTNPECDWREDVAAETLAALAKLDGSTASAVSVLTGMSRERLSELGGFED